MLTPLIYHKNIMVTGLSSTMSGNAFVRGSGIKRAQQGVSLLLALIFVAFFGGILLVLIRFDAREVRQNEARVTGWEAVEIARAARLYVRDRYANDPSLRTTAATPSQIALSTLKSSGYLAANFGRFASGHDISALNQEIYVVMTNWSANGLGGSVTDLATVPSAFIYFRNSSRSAPDLIVTAVESARGFGASVTAPLFDLTGANRSADCRGGGPAVGIWDTGCLQQSEFAAMASAAGLPSTVFSGGSLIIPAWKAIQPDLRAVMRYPQPENPGYATMLTSLQMGTPTGDCAQQANQVSITTLNSVGTPITTYTGLCKVLDDAAAGGPSSNDRRFSIDRVANIHAERLIAEPQSVDYGGETASIGTAQDDAMRITGDLTLDSNLQVYSARPLNGIPARFAVNNGTLAVERNTYVYSQNVSRKGVANIGTATARALVSDSVNAVNYVSTEDGLTAGARPRISATQSGTLSGNLSVSGAADAEMISEVISAPNAQIRALDTTGKAQITGTLNMNGTAMNVVGSGMSYGANEYAALVGEITSAGSVRADDSVRFLSPSNSISASSTAYYSGTPMPIVNTARCVEGKNVADACPNRQYTPPNITP